MAGCAVHAVQALYAKMQAKRKEQQGDGRDDSGSINSVTTGDLESTLGSEGSLTSKGGLTLRKDDASATVIR
jgi:hypothetical protein